MAFIPKKPKVKYTSPDKNVDQFIPGDIIRFRYVGTKTEYRTVLIISTERGPEGNFQSTQNNNLLCAVQLKENSPSFGIVLRLFYQNKQACDYKLLPGFLKFIFGLSAFKTFNIKKINNFRVLTPEDNEDATKENTGREVKVKDSNSFFNTLFSKQNVVYKARNSIADFIKKL